MPNSSSTYQQPLLDVDPTPPSPDLSPSPSFEQQQYTLYRARFLILFTFSLLSFNQSLFWLTFSPISDAAEVYYNISTPTVNLLLNWGPIIYLPLQFVTFYVSSARGGLRKIVLCSSTLCLVAMLLRCVPNLLWSPSSDAFRTNAIWFLHAAQILNAAAGPFVMSTVSQCSCLWFGVNERARATSVAIFSNNLGAAVGFLQIPAMVPRPDAMPSVLYTHAGMAIAASILTLAYFPAHPPSPPSHAAELLMSPIPDDVDDTGIVVDQHAHPADDAGEAVVVRLGRDFVRGMKNVFREFWLCSRNVNCLLLALVGGGVFGVFNGWSALFNNILSSLICAGQETCNNASVIAGWFGFASTVAAVVGGFVMGVIADQPRFSRHFKLLLLTSCALTFSAFTWFIFSVPTPLSPLPLLSSNIASLGVAVTMCGFTLGLQNPLCYELGAEVTYPVPEQYSAGFITLFNNGLGIVFIFAQPYFSDGLMNMAMWGTVVIGGVLVMWVRESYLRRDDDEKRKGHDVLDEVDVDESEVGNGIGKGRGGAVYKQRAVNGISAGSVRSYSITTEDM